MIWFDEIATKIFWLKTAANMSGSIAAGVSLLILCPPFVAICQSGGQGVNLQVRRPGGRKLLNAMRGGGKPASPTSASEAALVERREAQTARLRGYEYAQ
jgi:hypothetical protein